MRFTYAHKGPINVGKAIPVAGGLDSAAFDGVATNTVGNVARGVFITG